MANMLQGNTIVHERHSESLGLLPKTHSAHGFVFVSVIRVRARNGSRTRNTSSERRDNGVPFLRKSAGIQPLSPFSTG